MKKTPLKPNKDGVVLLSGGNPQIPMGDGDAPVQAFIAACPEWKHAVGKKLDALISKAVPKVRKAVKWNSPLYGSPGDRGFFLSLHCFTKFVRVSFFKGTALDPQPPGPSKVPGTRYFDVPQEGLEERQFVAWVKQAAAVPGWDPGGKSALRASSRSNPRNLPCPTCKRNGYQCDSCADSLEMGGY